MRHDRARSHHRLGTRVRRIFQQVALQETRIDADAHRAAVISLAACTTFAHALGLPDITGRDGAAGSACPTRPSDAALPAIVRAVNGCRSWRYPFPL